MQSSNFSFIYSIYPKQEPTYTFIIRMFATTRKPWQFSKMLIIGRKKSRQDDNTRVKMIVNKCDCQYRRKKKFIYFCCYNETNSSVGLSLCVCVYVCVLHVQIRLQHNHFLWMSSPISPSESWRRGGTESVSGSSLLSSSGRAGWAQFGWCTQSVFLKKR